MTNDTSVADREIVVSRTIHAPRRLVFEAFTDPQHLDQWMGPDGFTTTTHAFAFAAGAVWEYTMRGPDGTEYPNWVQWRTIEEPDRITWLHGEGPEDPNAFESTVTFMDQRGGTLVTLRSLFPTKAARDQAAEEYHAVEGAEQTLGRLASLVTARAQAR